jgi:anti-anti-sigma factor
VVAVSGELDLDSAEKLRAALHSPEAQAPTVVLDLRGLRFIDSSGLSVIVAHHQRAKAAGFRFAVAVGGASSVERLLDLTGLRGTLTIVDVPDAELVG